MRGRRADPERGRQAGEGVVAAQVHQHQQRLVLRAQHRPPRPDPGPVVAYQPGNEGQGRARQIRRGTILLWLVKRPEQDGPVRL